MKRVCFLGAGSWGTALAILCANNGHQVTIWSKVKAEIDMLRENREHKDRLPGVKLPDSIVNELVSKLEALTKKYETTFAEVETQISETEKTLSAMIDDLEGNEFDMLGLSEFKKMLGGVQND